LKGGVREKKEYSRGKRIAGSLAKKGGLKGGLQAGGGTNIGNKMGGPGGNCRKKRSQTRKVRVSSLWGEEVTRIL